MSNNAKCVVCLENYLSTPFDMPADHCSKCASIVLNEQSLNNWLLDNYKDQYFEVAKAAMQGLLSNSDVDLKTTTPEQLVRCAFNEADTFMKELGERLKAIELEETK